MLNAKVYPVQTGGVTTYAVARSFVLKIFLKREDGLIHKIIYSEWKPICQDYIYYFYFK
jgi:hypothetical protein